MSENDKSATGTESEKSDQRGRPKSRIGVITSAKMQKTVVVAVTRRAAHREYGKIQTLRVKFKVHAEDHDPKKPTLFEGDKVLIVETRPTSKDKRWRVQKVLERATKV